MAVLYNTGIFLYHLAIRISSLFNGKARLWVKGRQGLFERLADEIDPEIPIVWFHAASLGEFEQGRPVIEAVREKFPQHRILLTFFSPSGYEIRKNYEGADYIFYLPIDTRKNARRFINTVKPVCAVFIKYEFWFNLISRLHHKNIPVLVISSIFRKEQHFFQWYGGWFRKNLALIYHIFVQNRESEELLRSVGLTRVTVSGDTRFDRVASIAARQTDNQMAAAFSANSRVILGGSTWPPGEKLLANYLDHAPEDLKMIIAPHEVHEEHIQTIEAAFRNFKTIRYSQATEEAARDARVMIIDGIGFLSGLYRYCKIAYIGGGFGKGLHNILEAVTFGKPVVFGPAYRKFGEAVSLAAQGGAFPVRDEPEFRHTMDQLLTDEVFYQKTSDICTRFIENNQGATGTIMESIVPVLLDKQ